MQDKIINYCFMCDTPLEAGVSKCPKCGYECSFNEACPRIDEDGQTCIHTNDFCLHKKDYLGCEVLLRFD